MSWGSSQRTASTYAVLLVALIPLQALGADKPTAETAPQVKFDILLKQPPQPVCEQGDSDEIVVCAATPEDPEQFRLRPLKDDANFSKGPLKAEVALGENATLLAEGETADLGSGGQSKRAMVRLKIKF